MEPVDIMKKHFEFLICDYGFLITEEKAASPSYLGALIKYTSKLTQVLVGMDRADVYIVMGRSDITRNELFEFTYVINYLNPAIEKPYKLHTELNKPLEGSIDIQSKFLSELMQENCKQILLSGFTPEMEKQIREIEKKKVEWFLSVLKQKGKIKG